MRVVADTNTVISGIFWRGKPRLILEAARDGKIQVFTSAVLLAELEDVLSRTKFTQRLSQANTNAHEIVLGFASLATIVKVDKIDPVVSRDPDDDHVLACAKSANARIIVSGDRDLLDLKKYLDIDILTSEELLLEISK
jgi:putative PIN family toxin of toxin-antitoxin system